MSEMFLYGMSDLYLLVVGSLLVVCIDRIYFKSSRIRYFLT
jgi:hypothetical protein